MINMLVNQKIVETSTILKTKNQNPKVTDIQRKPKNHRSEKVGKTEKVIPDKRIWERHGNKCYFRQYFSNGKNHALKALNSSAFSTFFKNWKGPLSDIVNGENLFKQLLSANLLWNATKTVKFLKMNDVWVFF